MSTLERMTHLHPLLKRDVSSMNTETLQAVERVLTSYITSLDATKEKACPINTLPPELLGLIFEYVPVRPQVQEKPIRDPSTAFRIWEPAILDMRTMPVLSQVCRYWRDVCLQSSAQWSHAVDPHPAMQDTILKRSGNQPLKVLLTSSEYRWPRLLSEQGYRLQELHWLSFDLGSHSSCLEFPVPALRALTITGPRSSTSIHTSDASPEDNFPVLFADQMPSLQNLSLSSLAWLPNNRLDNLTCLYIDSCDGPNLLFRLLSLLGGCPNLEYLVLSALSDLAPERSGRIDGTIALGALRTLVLKQIGADDSAMLLEHLSLPASSAVRLADIFPVAGSLVQALAALPQVNAATRLAIDLTAAQPCVYAVGDISCVHVGEYTSWFHHEFWLANASVLVSRAQIKELWVRASGPVDRKHCGPLRDLVEALPELELLVVNDAIVELMGTMQKDLAFPTCPRLASVHVHCDGRINSNAIIGALLACRTQLACKHVLVCCTPEFPYKSGEWVVLNDCFNSLDYKFCESIPEMVIPIVCRTSFHMLWPSWLD